MMTDHHPARFQVHIKRWLPECGYCIYVDHPHTQDGFYYDHDLTEDEAYEVAIRAFADLLSGRPLDPRFQEVKMPF